MEESISIQRVKDGRNIYWEKLNELVYEILIFSALTRSKDSAEPGHISKLSQLAYTIMEK